MAYPYKIAIENGVHLDMDVGARGNNAGTVR